MLSFAGASPESLLSHHLPPSTPPPPRVLVLWSSDNHPGSAPILQLAASSFQNAGAPPHETKSKFQRRLRAVMPVCRHVNISSDVMFVQRFRSVPFMVVLSSKHDLLVVQTWPVHLIHTFYKHLHSPSHVFGGTTISFNIHRKAPDSAEAIFPQSINPFTEHWCKLSGRSNLSRLLLHFTH